MALMHRIHGRSMRGSLVKCGGIWKTQNEETGADYCAPSILHLCISAIRGTGADHDDSHLQAVIP